MRNPFPALAIAKSPSNLRDAETSRVPTDTLHCLPPDDGSRAMRTFDASNSLEERFEQIQKIGPDPAIAFSIDVAMKHSCGKFELVRTRLKFGC
jgi:hypothetical protein